MVFETTGVLPAFLPRTPESGALLDGDSKETGAWVIEQRQTLDLIGPLDQLLGINLPWNSYLMSPLILVFKKNTLVLESQVIPVHNSQYNPWGYRTLCTSMISGPTQSKVGNTSRFFLSYWRVLACTNYVRSPRSVKNWNPTLSV